MSRMLLLVLVGCGLENIEAKYDDSGSSQTVDPDPVDTEEDDDGGGAEDGGDETGGSATGGAATGGATTGGSGTGGSATGGTGGTDAGGTSGAGGTTGGSTGPCTDTEVEDCNGACASLDDLFRIGDGACDTTFPNWNCYTYSYDGGDCDEGPDPSDPGGGTGDATAGDTTGGETTDTGTTGGDEEVDYPAIAGGECDYSGEPGVYDCLAETCRPAWWLGDGVCDEIFDMDCPDTDWDGGDCDPAEEDAGVCHDVEYAEEIYVVDPADGAYTHDFSPECGFGTLAEDVGYLWSPETTGNYCVRVKSISVDESIAPVVSVWASDCATELFCAAGEPTDIAPSAVISAEFSVDETYVVALEHYSAFHTGFFRVEIEACAP